MAVTPTVAQLVDEVRLITDRKNDPTLTDSTIVTYLNDGVRSMYDAFLDSAPHWVQSSFDFTLVGDSDETSLVALPDDFQIDLGLDWLNPPGFTYPLTVRRLPTFLDRNRLNPYNALSASPPYFMRNYAVQGGNLQLYPKLNCGGDYRLYYQVQIAPLAYPVPREFNVTAGDDAQPDGWIFSLGNFVANDVGSVITPAFTQVSRQFNIDASDTDPPPSRWLFLNGNFTSSDVGSTLTPAFAAPNTAFNVTYTITAVINSSLVTVTPDPATFGSLTNPTSGTATVTGLSNSVFNVPYTITAVTSGQQISVTPNPVDLGAFVTPPTGTVSVASPAPGTIAALPRVFAPWQLYIKTFAAISVLTSFNEPADALQQRLAQETARVKRMAELRQSDLRQIPILGGGRGVDSPNYDSGGWGGGFGGDDW